MEKSFVTLELPAVLNLLAAEAESAPGREEALRLQPSVHPEEVPAACRRPPTPPG